VWAAGFGWLALHGPCSSYAPQMLRKLRPG
jgi:hypothetical protein